MVVLIVIRALYSALSSSASCNDVHDCRTVPSIIFNSASTIFLCTWVALHLDVPRDPQKAWWKRCLQRIKWVMIALLAPEFIFGRAFLDWTGSCNDLKYKLRDDPACGWTETHAMLARMNGLRVVKEDGSSYLCKRIRDAPSNVTMPTKEQIQERGKGDNIAKAITIIQMLWFAVQAAHRVSQHLVVTELELTVLAHFALNTFIYWCWWNKPLNLGFPVEVYMKKSEGTGREADGNRAAEDAESQRPTPRPRRGLSFRVKLGAYLDRGVNSAFEGWWGATIGLVAVAIIWGSFGTIHCLAWNSTFPSYIEQTLWRVSVLFVTASLNLKSIILSSLMQLNGRGTLLGIFIGIVIGLFGSVYYMARICLLRRLGGLAFASGESIRVAIMDGLYTSYRLIGIWYRNQFA